MADNYDNTASLWIVKTKDGKPRVAMDRPGKVGGAKFRVRFCPINSKSDSAPVAILAIDLDDGKGHWDVPLWAKHTEGKPDHLFGGSWVVAAGEEYWVNVWRARGGTNNGPNARVSFQAKEPGPKEPQQEVPAQTGDDIPF